MQPFQCPVCLGRGTVPNNFYLGGTSSSSTAPEMCRACTGNGIVWGPRCSDAALTVTKLDIRTS
jgi:DnaJ-class molecular chaperone